jgi:site-specific recombinase XerD
MGTVTKLRGERMTVREAVDAFLAHYVADLAAKTRAAYSATMAAFTGEFGDADVYQLDPDAVAAWFRSRWGERSAQTWNQNRSALKSAEGWWNDGVRRTEGQHWGIPDPFARIGRRDIPEDRTRALTVDQVRGMLDDTRTPIRERALWALLYESAARVHEVLALDVEDVDLQNHRARVVRKGGASDVIIWQRQGAMLLSRYLKGRKRGPLFTTERAARRDLGLFRWAARRAIRMSRSATSRTSAYRPIRLRFRSSLAILGASFPDSRNSVRERGFPACCPGW